MKHIKGQQVSIYLAYPTEARIKRLRELAKSWDLTDRMKAKRYKQIASDEAVEMAMAERNQKKLKAYERKWLAQQKKLKDKMLLKTVKQIASAIKKSVD